MLVPKRDPAATGPTNPFEVTSDGQSGEESDPAAAGSHSTFSLSGGEADGAAHAGAADAAVTVGVLGEVLLVVRLGVEEFLIEVDRAGLGGDLAVSGGAQPLLEHLPGG